MALTYGYGLTAVTMRVFALFTRHGTKKQHYILAIEIAKPGGLKRPTPSPSVGKIPRLGVASGHLEAGSMMEEVVSEPIDKHRPKLCQ